MDLGSSMGLGMRGGETLSSRPYIPLGVLEPIFGWNEQGASLPFDFSGLTQNELLELLNQQQQYIMPNR
jgi:hypothetical protein